MRGTTCAEPPCLCLVKTAIINDEYMGPLVGCRQRKFARSGSHGLRCHWSPAPHDASVAEVKVVKAQMVRCSISQGSARGQLRGPFTPRAVQQVKRARRLLFLQSVRAPAVSLVQTEHGVICIRSACMATNDGLLCLAGRLREIRPRNSLHESAAPALRGALTTANHSAEMANGLPSRQSPILARPLHAGCGR